MPPPVASSAENLASRLFLGPALRTQPDRRLVTLVREGYEAAFEEIVRRYRKPLDRFAAAIVGGRSEDVTQDAFSKALLALRGSEAEIELRPWLYRIVRNTALNDLRDSPPATTELGEALAAGRSVAEEAERREEMTDLMERLRALPEPQRAAIVMRELEGLSHEEIAAALGISGGAARQAIFRARQALRDGFGLLLPLPLLRLLIDHGAEAAGAGGAVAGAGAGAAAGAAGAAGGTGAALGGVGVGGALKVGVATALIAGSVGAGVAVEQRSDNGTERPAAAEIARGDSGAPNGSQIVASGSGPSATAGPGAGEGGDRRRSNDDGDDRQESGGGDEGHGRGSGDDGEVIGIPGDDRALDHGGPGPRHGGARHGPGGSGHDDGPGLDGHGPRPGGDGFGGDGSGHGGPGPGPRPPSSSGGSDSGRGGSGHSGGGGSDGPRGEGSSGTGSGTSGGSGRDGSGDGGGSGSSAEPPPEALPPLPEGESGDLRDDGDDDS
jgi:RNA polymerase sigma factor (sigma-70 family)